MSACRSTRRLPRRRWAPIVAAAMLLSLYPYTVSLAAGGPPSMVLRGSATTVNAASKAPRTDSRSAVIGTGTQKFASNTGNVIFLSAGILLPLVEDGRAGGMHTLRSLDALGSSMVIAEGLKYLVREPRPGHVGTDSFPSGHTTAAFAVATAESAFHPRQAPLWFAGATLIGASRVALHEHYIHDVIAGAALGYGMTRLELSLRHGLLLAPWVQPTSGSAGMQIGRAF